MSLDSRLATHYQVIIHTFQAILDELLLQHVSCKIYELLDYKHLRHEGFALGFLGSMWFVFLIYCLRFCNEPLAPLFLYSICSSLNLKGYHAGILLWDNDNNIPSCPRITWGPR